MWSFIALYDWEIQNIDEQNKYPLFYFPEILTQVVVCFDQARANVISAIFYQNMQSGVVWQILAGAFVNEYMNCRSIRNIIRRWMSFTI